MNERPDGLDGIEERLAIRGATIHVAKHLKSCIAMERIWFTSQYFVVYFYPYVAFTPLVIVTFNA